MLQREATVKLTRLPRIMTSSCSSVETHIGGFFVGLIAGFFIAAAARYAALRHSLKTRTNLQDGENMEREGQRKLVVSMAEDAIYDQERKFGEGKETRKWIALEIARIPVISKQDVV